LGITPVSRAVGGSAAYRTQAPDGDLLRRSNTG